MLSAHGGFEHPMVSKANSIGNFGSSQRAACRLCGLSSALIASHCARERSRKKAKGDAVRSPPLGAYLVARPSTPLFLGLGRQKLRVGPRWISPSGIAKRVTPAGRELSSRTLEAAKMISARR